MKGTAGIPSLHLEVLNKLVTKFERPPSTFFSSLFPSTNYDSDTIKWELEYNSGGMTPFVAPGSVAPAIGLDGIGEASAKCAYMKEKMFFGEDFLNNLREPGTSATYQTAERNLSRGLRKLSNRIDRRREWMMAQMVMNGSLSYKMQGGTELSVSYGVPATHRIQLASGDHWDAGGATQNVIRDIYDAKTLLADDAGVQPKFAVCNSTQLKYLIQSSAIQTLLAKSAFGNGDLFANPGPVLASLLGVGSIVVYDELYEVTGWITSAVTASDTTIYLDDVSDFETGSKARFFDMSEYNTYEDKAITAVDKAAGTITVAAVTGAYKAREDRVIMRKKFIPDNVFMLFSDTDANGEKVAEFMQAPYGMNRTYGKYSDTKDEWDPDGVWLRVQDKGLPVLYHPDCSIIITTT